MKLYLLGNFDVEALSNFTLGEVISPPVWTMTSLPTLIINQVYDSGVICASIISNSLLTNIYTQVGGVSLKSIGLTLVNTDDYCKIIGTPTVFGSYDITLRATNKDTYSDKNFTLIIYTVPIWVIKTISHPLQANSYDSGEITVTYGSVFTQIAGTSLTSMGLRLDSYDGYCKIIGTPNTNGNFNITIRASNDGIYHTDQVLNLVIVPVNPIWTTTSLPNGKEDIIYNSGNIDATYALTFEDIGITTLTSLGLSLDSHAGYCNISGYPIIDGQYTIKLRANNNELYTEKIFNITIANGDAPVFVTNTLPTDLLTTSAYSADINITIPTKGYLTSLTATSGSLPSWSTFTYNSTTGYARLYGDIPTEGTYNFTLTAVNRHGSTSKAYSFTLINPFPVWTTLSLPTGTQYTSYNSGHINATCNYPIVFSQVDGTSLSSLGLSLTSYNTYCTITGTIENIFNSYNIKLRAADGGSYTDRFFPLTINPITPVWTTSSLPSTTQNTSYNSGNITATYAQSFSRVGGAVLSDYGLTLNSYVGYCTIVGTIKRGSSPTFIIRADNNGSYIDRSFTVNITPIQPVWTSSTTAMGAFTQDSNYSVQLNCTYGEVFSIVSGEDITQSPFGFTFTSSIGFCTIAGKASPEDNNYNYGVDYPSQPEWWFTIRSSNNGLDTDRDFRLRMNFIRPAPITNSITPRATQGQHFESDHIVYSNTSDYILDTPSQLDNIVMSLNDYGNYCTISGDPGSGTQWGNNNDIHTGDPGTYSVSIRGRNHTYGYGKTYSVYIDPATPVWYANGSEIQGLTKGTSVGTIAIACDWIKSVSQSAGTTLSSMGLTLSCVRPNSTSNYYEVRITGTPNKAINTNITLKATNSGNGINAVSYQDFNVVISLPDTEPPPPSTNAMLLMHFDGNLNDVYGHSFSAVGNAGVSSNRAKFGTTSLYCSNGGYIQCGSSSDFIFNSNFTIEMWQWNEGTGRAADSFISNNNSVFRWINNLSYFIGAGNNHDIGSTGVPTGSWKYVSISRVNGVLYSHIDGVYKGSISESGTFGSGSSSELTIGAEQYQNYIWYFKGNIDELRISPEGKYTNSNYSVPTGPFTN